MHNAASSALRGHPAVPLLAVTESRPRRPT